MVLPGYYKSNPRALSVRDLIGVGGGLIRLPFAWLVTRFMAERPGGWLPELWAEIECQKEQLSARFWEVTSAQRDALASLGFQEVGFLRIARTLDPSHRDNGEITYLDPTRRHVASVVYVHMVRRGLVVQSFEKVVVAFSAGFADGSLHCTNNKTAFAPPPGQRTIRVATQRIDTLYQRFVKELARSGKTPIEFVDKQSLARWFDSSQTATLEERVQRGLFVRMTDAEIEAAGRKLPPPIPAAI